MVAAKGIYNPSLQDVTCILIGKCRFLQFVEEHKENRKWTDDSALIPSVREVVIKVFKLFQFREEVVYH